MLIEVGKTYINRDGYVCKVVCRTDEPLCIGVCSYYSYFPLENGRENRETAFRVDMYGSHLGEGIGGDLIGEYRLPDLEWAWCKPDKIGLWACGGYEKTVPASLKTSGVKVIIVDHFFGVEYHVAWRCYLGPIPQISQPKKLVKQTLWMVKYYTTGVWQELWLPDGEVPKYRDFQDIGHKTTTTREA